MNKQKELCKMLGIQYPILQGGMAWVANATLAGAVSEAGGLGIIAAMSSNGEQLREEIHACRKITSKPFGVNVMLMSPFCDEVAKVIIEEKVPVVTTGAGNPSKYMPSWLEAGIVVLPVVPSTALAKMAQRSGASAVIAEGGEAGGHVGEITTMTLVPQICDAVDIPVIAAGGIADGRGVAAAYMLGASAVQLGTRFLVAKECTIHQNYKDRILSAKDIDTVTTGKRLGHPVRSLKNQFTREYLRKEYDSTISDEELQSLGEGRLRLAVIEGNIKDGCVLAGQVCGLIKKEQTCSEIIEEIFKETHLILQRGCQWEK